jgi:hypothetical protein
VYPTARKLQPLLAELRPTNQSITLADLRTSMRKAVSFRQYLTLGVSQAVTSAALVVMVVQKTNGGRVSVFEDAAALLFAFLAAVLAVSSISFLIVALDKFRHKKDEPGPTNRAFRSFLAPVLSLVVSVGLLGFVVTNATRINERNQASALIRDQLDTLTARIDRSNIPNRAESLKARIAANSAHLNELIVKFNSPAVKCETTAVIDDPGRVEKIATCRERARKEQDTVQREIAATNEESAVIKHDYATLQKENDAIRAQLDVLRTEIKAIRR